jgi:DNA-binding transcriptional MerR regulator
VSRAPTDRSHLSIGEVLSLLQDEFPDVTISKIRFLESQGLLDPERTPSGYRKFYETDIERLRWILRQQKDHYLPLKVIKDRLDDLEPPPDEREPTTTGGRRQPGAGRAGRARRRGGWHEAQGWEDAPREGRSWGDDRGLAWDDAPDQGSAAWGQAPDDGPSRGSGPQHEVVAADHRPAPTSRSPGSTPPVTPPTVSIDDRRAAPEARPRAARAGSANTTGGAEPAPRQAPDAPARPTNGTAHPPVVPLAPGSPAAPGAAPVGGAGPASPLAGSIVGEVGIGPSAGSVSLTIDELAEASGMAARDLRDLERFGLLDGHQVGDDTYYDGDALLVARTAAGFLQHGIEARHLRTYKVAVDREAGLFEQIVLPLLKQRNPEAHRRAARTVAELVHLGEVMRGVLLRRELRNDVGP